MNGFLHVFWLVAFFNSSPVQLYPVPSDDYVLRQGWYNNKIVWYVPFAASNPTVARQLDYFVDKTDPWPNNPVIWAPRLDCVDPFCCTRDVYFLNCAQTTVFSTEPGTCCYSPLWRVHYLEWAPGLPKIALTNEADIVAAIVAGDLLEKLPPSILDATIVIDSAKKQTVKLAKLSWPKHLIQFYAYPVFYSDKNCKKQETRYIVITDTNVPDAAEQLGANYAPALSNVSPACCDWIYAFITPIPPGQLPIVKQKPEPKQFDWQNTNKLYTPIRCWTLFQRTGLPQYVVVNNQPFMDKLLFQGLVAVVNPNPGQEIITNSPDSLIPKAKVAP